jgi:hypothetical protein
VNIIRLLKFWEKDSLEHSSWVNTIIDFAFDFSLFGCALFPFQFPSRNLVRTGCVQMQRSYYFHFLKKKLNTYCPASTKESPNTKSIMCLDRFLWRLQFTGTPIMTRRKRPSFLSSSLTNLERNATPHIAGRHQLTCYYEPL